ncbi:hypothetical protein E3H11_22565 [Bradyrhizobium brasilense]|nr:hypothetical protein [Bradyrhizobium brasilense]
MRAIGSRKVSLRQMVNELACRLSKLMARAHDWYRPERHYIRGPGPKWFSKHGASASVTIS